MLKIRFTIKVKPEDLQWFKQESSLYDLTVLHEENHTDGYVYLYCGVPSYALTKALFEKLDSEQRNISLLV